jgi:hypothetical protein
MLKDFTMIGLKLSWSLTPALEVTRKFICAWKAKILVLPRNSLLFPAGKEATQGMEPVKKRGGPFYACWGCCAPLLICLIAV